MSGLRRLGASLGPMLSRPAVAIPVLTLSAAGLLTGLGRLLFEDWLIAILCALGILLVFLLGFLLWSMLVREHERRLQAGIEPAAQRPEPSESLAAAAEDALEDTFLRGLADWGRSGSARQLPWYLMLGEAGAGKTLALADSGLELPADTSRFFGPGPTRSVAWCPTNQAIVLDTSGRYVEDEEPGTRREWRSLLRLIRKHGRRVPLQGIVAAVSLRTLLTADDAELQRRAHRLRRRLNEVAAELRSDAPIYVLVTQADAIEGLLELAGALPHGRLDEALGWTNPYRRYSDPALLVRKAFGPTLERIERLLPDVLMREADAVRRRRLLLFPGELEVALERVGSFLEHAFGRSVYGAIPFMRGVYLTSAVQKGATVSATLERLGHGWATHSVDGFRPQRGLFLRDVFRRIIVDREEATLATPARELSPAMRRAVLSVGGLATAAVALLLGSAFASNLASLRHIRDDFIPAQVQRPSLDTLSALRSTLLEVEERHREPWRRMGLAGPLESAAQQARALVADRFEGRFERPTKARMLQQADQLDERAFAALSALALDVAWLASGAAGDPPELARFVECRDCGPRASEQFADVYAAWARWAPDRARERALEEQQALSRATPALLTLANVDRWCAAESDVCRPVRFEDFELPAPDDCTPVRGAYTQATWDQLLSQLVEAVQSSGRASQVDVERFMKDYRRAYAQEWEAFVRCVPRRARAEIPEQSVYLDLWTRLADNTRPGSQWSERGARPEWFDLVQELVRTQPREEGEVPPGSRYGQLLETLTTDVQRVRAQPQAALAVVRGASRDSESPYRKGLELVEDLVPLEAGAERAVRAQLRTLLEMPILNGFSATVAAAREVVDEQWRDQIAGAFAGPIGDTSSLRALYDPQGGALARFDREWLSGFYGSDGPVPLLRDRAMVFGPGFERWLRSARALQRGLFASEARSLRIQSFPGELEGRPGVYLTQRMLELVCPQGVQVFTHANAGSGRDEKVFQWTPACDAVRLRLDVQATTGFRETLPEKTWSGPFALAQFLREAVRADDRFEWTFAYPGGLTARVAYRVSGADALLRFEHRRPPGAVGE